MNINICRTCGEEKEMWPKRRICRQCKNAEQQSYYNKNKNDINARIRKNYKKQTTKINTLNNKKETVKVNGCTLIKKNDGRCVDYFNCPYQNKCIKLAAIKNWKGWEAKK